ncbi:MULTISPECIES: cobaltochelatase subunit CobN [unclassified Leptolyngbya]|uniref:cobaltochelatase subunit CobN n=1 Tax=unclassified Leptolyngbya TaxID=2650499 RepID=UPI001689BFA5|nr:MULTISPECIES: cobaltochelatase subunit CobN [unclassified Leptolyngbya]MBD1912968.1 cobaltochelatase subunit CobN [Leptolyngbya sp. FACHB-8]MBD2155721.1 cobaltochelatase subunit CobN [Leptolyngbya sp. FACHB-16]
MHRLPASPGGWNPDTEGVIFIDQTPAPIIFLTAADTDILLLGRTVAQLPSTFPEMRVANLLQLQQQLTIDTYADTVLAHASVIVLRLLGGRAYWPYGLEVVRQTVEQTGAALLVLPGDDRPDPELISHSTVPLALVNQFWRYLTEGGLENMVNGLRFLEHACLNQPDAPPPPKPVPRVGCLNTTQQGNATDPRVGILFYRAHYLAGNVEPVEALSQAIAQRHLQPVPIFVSSLRDPDAQEDLLAILQPKDGPGIDALLNTTSFSLAQLDTDAPDVKLWETLDVPIIQTIFSGGSQEQWKALSRGLSPRDVAMNVALPEVDGRIIGRAVSFKAVVQQHPQLQVEGVGYRAVGDRIQWTADLAQAWVTLRRTPPEQRKVALILANYPSRDGRLANGVGLDTPASCVEILRSLHHAGYTLTEVPETGDALIDCLTSGVTNDPEGQYLRAVHQYLPLKEYQTFFDTLPEAARQGIIERWGQPSSEHFEDKGFPIPGIQFGNVFVGIQPPRGYDRDPSLNYHAPDLEPTHDYLAYYQWLRQHFGAQAIAHVGKHGNLEWLPGKSVALSEDCYPEIALGPLPHLYPFIVNDPGEGSQAKRRAQAVILDHLTPPMTRAELYGSLMQLEALVDEYYEAQSLDPTRLPAIQDRIEALVRQENLTADLQTWLGATEAIDLKTADWGALLTGLDACLCDLKEAQIRDGLHVFGQCPEGRQLRDLVVAIARHPGPQRLGLTRAIAQDWQLSFDPLTATPNEPWEGILPKLFNMPCRHQGDVIEQLEIAAATFVESLLEGTAFPFRPGAATVQELAWVGDRLLPNLRRTSEEITHLLRGLDGRYVPSGASGAPTRGRPDVLPTGRNFYSVDIRAIPTETAWDVGRRAAETLIERYTQENGEYPQTLGLSIWGTSTMRTGGDDLAEALALLGVRPVWDGPSRRVVDFEILPVSALGRPRVDVTLRISGFFRDAFPNLIDLFHQAVQAVAALPEPAEENPLAARSHQEAQDWIQQGLSAEQAEGRSRLRIFGSKPGAYGAGLQGLIEAQNWSTDDDLARAYLNWSSYAYTSQGDGQSAPEAFAQRLRQLQIVLHNQDNREHDLLDSDDYYQFQGGMTAAVRSLTGQNPTTYFGDHSLPENPRVRTLQEEMRRVYRSRVINPKWIAGVMRHGYKGAFEMAATVDYLFAYDATARCADDFMYQGVAEAYVLDETVQAFVQSKNPWALRDMAERLLEAHQRGLWQQVDRATLDELRAIAHAAEATIEAR